MNKFTYRIISQVSGAVYCSQLDYSSCTERELSKVAKLLSGDQQI